MPCDCELDLIRRWVKARAWGTITYGEAMATRHKFITDSGFSPDFHQLYDGREVTRIALTASEIGDMARTHIFGPKSRRAFLAPRSDTYGLARMFKIYREINSGQEQIEVFRTIEEAEVWLAGSLPSALPIRDSLTS